MLAIFKEILADYGLYGIALSAAAWYIYTKDKTNNAERIARESTHSKERGEWRADSKESSDKVTLAFEKNSEIIGDLKDTMAKQHLDNQILMTEIKGMTKK